jgi:hypothetical protein
VLRATRTFAGFEGCWTGGSNEKELRVDTGAVAQAPRPEAKQASAASRSAERINVGRSEVFLRMATGTMHQNAPRRNDSFPAFPGPGSGASLSPVGFTAFAPETGAMIGARAAGPGQKTGKNTGETGKKCREKRLT